MLRRWCGASWAREREWRGHVTVVTDKKASGIYFRRAGAAATSEGRLTTTPGCPRRCRIPVNVPSVGGLSGFVPRLSGLHGRDRSFSRSPQEAWNGAPGRVLLEVEVFRPCRGFLESDPLPVLARYSLSPFGLEFSRIPFCSILALSGTAGWLRWAPIVCTRLVR